METQDIIFTITAAIFILASLKLIFYWVWFWQLKEYRADRMRAHFQDIGAKNSFLMFIGYSALRQNKMPRFTVKVWVISALSILVYFLFIDVLLGRQASKFTWTPGVQVKVFQVSEARAIWFLLAVFMLSPVIIFLMVLVVNSLSNILKRRIIRKAREKIGKMPNLTVIGITGSYGKSTTKEIMASVLEKKYKVLKTPANINTAIGIAEVILKDLSPEHQIFIAEMGAYKLGEIKEICDMTHPKIGIITAVNEQHLALFGSVKNIIRAKFELIDSLPKEGTAILNVGDKNIQMGLGERKNIKSEVKLYSVGEKSDFYAINVSVGARYVKFKLISGQEMQDFTLNAIGTHNISNALAAIIVAKKMGIGLLEVSQMLQRANRLAGTFKTSVGYNNATFLDDTYNANPDGVMAALNYLKNQRGKKIIVMSSLIELGPRAHQVHKELGKEISKIAAKLIFLDGYYFGDIRAGVLENKSQNWQISAEVELEKSPRKVARRLKQELKDTDTVVFINRGAGKVLEELKK